MESFTLECFLAIAESGSFTKAAQRVCRTQSAVTQQICNLEKKLNTRLFNRAKQVSLTQQGELFLPYALKIYALHQEVLDRFKNPELDGEVRFGVPEDFATLFLADVLVHFSRIHPRVFLNVECDLTLNLFNRFKNGMLDIVLVKMSSSTDFPHGVEVWQEPLVWVSQQGVVPQNTPLPLVLSPDPCVYRARAIAALERASIRWRVVYASPSYAGTIAAVKANMGVTVLPITMIPKGLNRINGSFLPSLPDLHVSLLKQAGPLSPAIATLEEFLLKQL
jgi:DNA-binding transcriptional LysR family regulator